MLSYFKHTSIFKQPGGTSRGVLHTKDSWIIRLQGNESVGYGEVSIIPKLSLDNPNEIEGILDKLKSCSTLDHFKTELGNLSNFPAIQFALECAILDYLNPAQPHLLYPSNFSNGTRGIPINGLIWMGEKEPMLQQIETKLEAGFTCLKMKVGAIDFEKELSILQHIRSAFSPTELELRVDANGAFSPLEAEEKLKQLSTYHIHSIEQPIQQNQWVAMAYLCQQNIIPIALDEELIGCTQKELMLNSIQPQYIILKPSLLGGFEISEQWVALANKLNMGWWATSALETNIGLNAIAQWTATQNNPMPQGLGTGQVFTNNFASPLELKGENLYSNSNVNWEIPNHLFQ